MVEVYLAELLSTFVDDAFLRICCETDSNMDQYGQQENDEVNENIVDFSDNSDTDTLAKTETQSADLGIQKWFHKSTKSGSE